MGVSQVQSWGHVSPEVKEMIVESVERGWATSNSWESLQSQIAGEFGKRFGTDNVAENVKVSELGVQGSDAEIDVVTSADLGDPELGGFLLQISGGSAYPRHEKELLEFISVSAVNKRFQIGVLIVSCDNTMKLEGGRSSWDYCRGSLLRLVTPGLEHSTLTGLLIVGLPRPK